MRTPSCPSRPEASVPSVTPLSSLQFFPRNHHKAFDLAKAPVASLPVINTVYQYARFTKTSGQEGAAATLPSTSSSSSADALYRWHLPDPGACGDGSSGRSQTVAVLLGWLGSKQKHLKRYADWYTSRGFHAVTFTLPMSDIVSYNVRGKAERNVEMLSEHLADWVREKDEEIVFHTFSNTGWLCYGVILENLQQKDPSAVQKIKGSIIDSAPVAVPDSQVWALGFSAAIMKKHSIATKGAVSNYKRSDVLVVESQRDIKPAATEAVLLSALEKFFDVVLNYPAINRRLSGIMEILSSNQPNCPQLYIYSSADRVIPAKSVESFVEAQRKAGCEVRSCNFVSSPHVDHYRSNPGLYTSQLTNFLEECVLACREDSPSSSSPA